MHPAYAPRLLQQETKSSTKQLAPTDPILGPENLLKTGFAQKGLLVAFPVAISHKASLKPKRCASATLIQKTSKMNLNTVPKMEPPGGPILGPHAQLSKRTKESTFTVPFLGPSGGTKNETAKSQNQQQGRPVQQTKMTVKQQAYSTELEHRNGQSPEHGGCYLAGINGVVRRRRGCMARDDAEVEQGWLAEEPFPDLERHFIAKRFPI